MLLLRMYTHQQKQNPEHPKNTQEAAILVQSTANFQVPQSLGTGRGQGVLVTIWDALVISCRQNSNVRFEAGEEDSLVVRSLSWSLSLVVRTPPGSVSAGPGTSVTPGSASAGPAGSSMEGTVATLQLAP